MGVGFANHGLCGSPPLNGMGAEALDARTPKCVRTVY